MEKEVVTCEGCGAVLRKEEVARGLAHTEDHRSLCTRCLLLYSPAPTPTFPVGSPRPRRGSRQPA
jgi:hypothetical protein